MTKREMYEAIVKIMETGECSIEPAEVIEFCEKEIAALDRKAEKAKERAAEKKAAGDELTAIVASVMSADEFEPIAEIAARVEFEDATLHKVQYRLGELVKAGKAEKQEITIPGGEGQKSRKVMGYKLCAE